MLEMRQTFHMLMNHSMPFTCAFGLSHIENLQAAVNEALRVLKAGGYFVFTLWFGSGDGDAFHKIIQDAMTAFGTNAFTFPQNGPKCARRMKVPVR